MPNPPAKPERNDPKGTFGRPFGRVTERVALPLSKRYMMPNRRLAMVLVGLAAGVVVALLAWLDVRYRGGTALSGGPVSSAHATLEADCSSCHGGEFRRLGESVADAACASCHERQGQDSVFAFTVHAERAPDDGTGTVDRGRLREPRCADCHREHQGRDASLRAVSDRRCQSCHRDSDFDDGHPEFAFAAAPESDDDALHFPHGRHVQEILKRTGWDEPERTCLRCHQPTDDGRGFGAIVYGSHCADCHLGAAVVTGRLPLAEAGTADGSGTPGVWDLERIRASGLPDTDWAFYVDPGSFRTAGRRVAKLRLGHEDPWILFNLRQLRRQRYGDAGVADLLVTTPASGDAAPAEYRQAVDALESQAAALRGSADPAVQAELAWIEDQLRLARERLGQPHETLATVTLPASDSGSLAPEQEAAWDELVNELSAPCANCHRLDRATIVAIDPDQRVLEHAEFDHAPHVVERGCLECHDALPIRQALTVDDPAALAALPDRSAIHNLPRIATCRQCHGGAEVASACVDCHSFHPDSAARRARQLASLGVADLRDDHLPDDSVGNAP